MSKRFPFLILTYTFTANGTDTEYTIPVMHTVKKMFVDDDQIFEGVDWMTPEQHILNATTMICVSGDKITLPDSTSTKTYKIQYR